MKISLWHQEDIHVTKVTLSKEADRDKSHIEATIKEIKMFRNPNHKRFIQLFAAFLCLVTLNASEPIHHFEIEAQNTEVGKVANIKIKALSADGTALTSAKHKITLVVTHLAMDNKAINEQFNIEMKNGVASFDYTPPTIGSYMLAAFGEERNLWRSGSLKVVATEQVSQ